MWAIEVPSVDLKEMKKRGNIYLTGFMGTGKSVVGPRLAQKLGYKFVDTDELIEQRAGKGISEIFAQDGESHFRYLEREVVREVSCSSGQVVALGGGAILNPDNLDTIKASGVLVCLRATPEVIWSRTKDSTKRPLLEGSGGEDPQGGETREQRVYRRIKALLAWREPYYQEADFDVDTSHLTPEGVVEKIVRKLRDLAHEGG